MKQFLHTPMKHLINKNILIISPEPWDHIPVSKHHYARALASLGNNVFFLNPPAYENSVTRDAKEANVNIVNYKTIRGANRLPALFRDGLNSVLIRKIKRLCKVNFDVVWSFDSFRFQNMRLWETDVKIYHVVDVHKAPLEFQLFESADVILSVSKLILERITAKDKITAQINHGLARHFLEPPAVYENNSSGTIKPEMKVGYVGNLDNWCVDHETLFRIVMENPDINFMFIGPYKTGSEIASHLTALPNVKLLGRVETEQLPCLLNQMTVFLMCYYGADAAVNSNHHKILEFLSTGKPTVINYTDEYKDKRDLVIMSDHNEELPALFQKVCGNIDQYTSPFLVAKRKEYAASNTYASQIERIDLLLNSLID